jgi:hypothetical protein
MRYLLDTNVVSDLIRTPQGHVAEHIRKVGETQVCISIELRPLIRIEDAGLAEPGEGPAGRLDAEPRRINQSMIATRYKTPAASGCT